MTKFQKALRKTLDNSSKKEWEALKVGMAVRNADGWIGEIVSKASVIKRNGMGHIRWVEVKITDMSSGMCGFHKVGDTFFILARNFRPLSSGLVFSDGSWKAAI